MFLPIRLKQGKPDYEMLTEYLSKKKDGIYYVRVELSRKPRSLNQNNYYWGVVLPIIADYTGNTPDELHNIFKRMFLPPKTIMYRNKAIKMPSSTTELSTVGFAEYIDRITAEAGELGVSIPPPNDFKV